MSLPSELIYAILDELWLKTRPEVSPLNTRKIFYNAVLHCSSTAKPFRAYLLPKILSHIECKSRRRLKGLSEILTENASLIPLIKSFHIHQITYTSIKEDVWITDDQNIPFILDILRQGSHLEALTIEVTGFESQFWSFLDHTIQDSIYALVQSRRLKFVRFAGVAHIAGDLLDALYRDVESVQLELDTVSQFRAPPPSNRRASPVDVVQHTRCEKLDLGVLSIPSLPHFCNTIESRHSRLEHLVLRHHKPLFVQNQSFAPLFHALRASPSIRRLSIIHDASEPPSPFYSPKG